MPHGELLDGYRVEWPAPAYRGRPRVVARQPDQFTISGQVRPAVAHMGNRQQALHHERRHEGGSHARLVVATLGFSAHVAIGQVNRRAEPVGIQGQAGIDVVTARSVSWRPPGLA